MACPNGGECSGGNERSGNSGANNRTIVIPSGTLDGNVTNVVVIPENLENANRSLIVRGPALDANVSIPDADYDVDFDVPLPCSTFTEDVHESFYDSLEDSSSGEMSSGMLADVMGGAYNVIAPASPASPYRPPEPNSSSSCSGRNTTMLSESGHATPEDRTPNSFYDSLEDSSSGEMSSGMLADVMGGAYNVITPGSPASPYRPPVSFASSSSSSGRNTSRFSDSGRSVADCQPCLPDHGGNPDWCPPPCPVRGDWPDASTTGSFPSMDSSGLPPPCSPNLTRAIGLAPHPRRQLVEPANVSGDITFPDLEGLVPPWPLDQTRMIAAPDLNITRPIAGGQAQYLNRTRAGGEFLDRTRIIQGALNRTRPVVDPIPIARPHPVMRTSSPIQDRTFPRDAPDLGSPIAGPNRSFGSPPPACRPCDVPRARPNVITSTPEGNRTFIRPNIDVGSPIAGPNRSFGSPPAAYQTYDGPRARPNVITSTPEGNRTFIRPDFDAGSPIAGPNRSLGSPPAAFHACAGPRGRPNVRTSTPEGNRTFVRPYVDQGSPIAGPNRSLGSPPAAYPACGGPRGRPNVRTSSPEGNRTFVRPDIDVGSTIAGPNRSIGTPPRAYQTADGLRGRPNFGTSTPEDNRTCRSPDIDLSPIPHQSRTSRRSRKAACGLAPMPGTSTPEANRTFARPDFDAGSPIRAPSPARRSPGQPANQSFGLPPANQTCGVPPANETLGVPPANQSFGVPAANVDQTYDVPVNPTFNQSGSQSPCKPCPSEMQPGTPDLTRSTNRSFSIPSSPTSPGISVNRTGSKINVNLSIDLTS